MRTIITAVSLLMATLATGQVVPIPNDAIVVFDTLSTGPGSRSYWICPGASLEMHQGSTTIFMEEYSNCTYGTGNGSSTIYVKNNATLHYQSAGGDNIIYYESGAVLDTTGPIGYNFFIESMDIIFDYSDAPKHGCSVSGIEENFTAMQAYPNPTTGVVNITFPGDASLTVFNSLGQALFTSGQSCTVDLAQFGSGWYVVQVTGDQVITKAILVK